jgi:4-aminobutyrate aminotransferase
MSDMVKIPNIRVEPPGPKANKIIQIDDRYLATSTKSTPLVVSKAQGSVVWDVDENVYLDFSSGVSVLNIGHCHPKVTDAIARQAKLFAHFAGTDYYHELQARLSERLCKLAPGGCNKKIFLSNSGTESIEAAMKLARWSTERKQFVSFINGFHGRTLGSLSLTASKAVQQERYFPSTPGVTRIPYGYCYRCAYHLEYPSCGLWCAKMIEEVHFDTHLPPEEVAAFFLEPVQGEGGYIVPPKEFPRIISKICKAHGILLVDDEVQAGMARTGKFWAIEHFGVVPDVVCTAKALGSGVPIGATIFRSELDWQKKGSHSNTFGGNALACAAAMATLDVIEKEKLVKAAEKRGRYLNRRLHELMEEHPIIGDVRGLGLMQATEFVLDRRTKEPAVKARDEIELLAFKRGLIILGCGRSAMRYIPPLTISEKMIDAGIEVLDGVIRDVSLDTGVG